MTGHSVGEYVAAAVAGVFSPEDGLRLITERGRLLSELPRTGGMVAVFSEENIVADAIAAHRAHVSIAAVNGTRHVVISGELKALEAIVASLDANGITTKKLNISHAFHSPLTEPVLEPFRLVAKSISFRPPKIGFVSCVTGKLARDEVADPEYWVRHVRQPVRFDRAVETLGTSSARLFVEIGPKPVLTALAEAHEELEKKVLFLPSLRPNVDDVQQCRESFGRLFVHGASINWSALYQGRLERHMQLPTYPFQRKRHWFKSADLCYRAVWQEKPLDRRQVTKKPGRWLILSNQEWPELTRAMREADRQTIFVSPGTEFNRATDNQWAVDPNSPASYRRLLEEAGPLEGIVYLWPETVDLAPVECDGDADRLRDELLDPQGEDCVALQGDQRYVNRLEGYRPAEVPPPKLSRDAAYLITGGFGALGLQVARYFAERGAGCLTLMGRSVPSDEVLLEVSRLEKMGSRVLIVQGDVTDESALSRMRDTIDANSFELKGIVHAAGTNQPCLIAELDPQRLRSTLAAKIAGALNLHRLTEDAALEFFICFSSISAVWGSARQSHYAAANSFLDGLIEYRRGCGLPGLAVNWGPWKGEGMSNLEAGRRVADSGLKLLAPDQALPMLGLLMDSKESRVTVCDVDWARLKNLYQVHGRQPLFENVGRQTAPAASIDQAMLVAELQTTSPAERFELLAGHVRSLVADVMKLDGDQTVELYVGFFDMGIDSLMAIQVKDRVQRLVGREFPASLCFDYPNVAALVEHLLKVLFPPVEDADSPLVVAKESPGSVLPKISENDVQELSDQEIADLIEAELNALN